MGLQILAGHGLVHVHRRMPRITFPMGTPRPDGPIISLGEDDAHGGARIVIPTGSRLYFSVY